MADIKPYTIAVSDSTIEDLKLRLSLARFPDELEGAGWDMGCPLDDIRRLTKHWQESYDWRAAERELNKLPNYVTPIQCDGFEALDIHFVHMRSSSSRVGQKAIPLLFIHGWPGHFQEVIKILKPLTEGGGDDDDDDKTPVFDVVAPSLPNFGFSQGTKKRGFALEQYAETLNKLMLKLGYDEYVTQGGKYLIIFGFLRETPNVHFHQNVSLTLAKSTNADNEREIFQVTGAATSLVPSPIYTRGIAERRTSTWTAALPPRSSRTRSSLLKPP